MVFDYNLKTIIQQSLTALKPDDDSLFVITLKSCKQSSFMI